MGPFLWESLRPAALFFDPWRVTTKMRIWGAREEHEPCLSSRLKGNLSLNYQCTFRLLQFSKSAMETEKYYDPASKMTLTHGNNKRWRWILRCKSWSWVVFHREKSRRQHESLIWSTLEYCTMTSKGVWLPSMHHNTRVCNTESQAQPRLGSWRPSVEVVRKVAGTVGHK